MSPHSRPTKAHLSITRLLRTLADWLPVLVCADVLQNLQYFFGAPVAPEKLKDVSTARALKP